MNYLLIFDTKSLRGLGVIQKLNNNDNNNKD